MSTCRRMQVDTYISPCTKLKSKWIKGFNISLTKLNLIEKKVESFLQCMDTGDHFLNITQETKVLKATINKWTFETEKLL